MRLALAEQVPAPIQLDLQLGQAGVALIVRPLAFAGLEQLPLLGDHRLDPVAQVGVVHRLTLAPTHSGPAENAHPGPLDD